MQGAWIVAVAFICLGLLSMLVSHDLFLGSGQLVVGVVFATDNILAKCAVSKKSRILFKISAVIIYLILSVPLFFLK